MITTITNTDKVYNANIALSQSQYLAELKKALSNPLDLSKALAMISTKRYSKGLVDIDNDTIADYLLGLYVPDAIRMRERLYNSRIKQVLDTVTNTPIPVLTPTIPNFGLY